MNFRRLLALASLTLAACAAPDDSSAGSSANAIEATGKPVIIGEGFEHEAIALSTLDTAHLGMWLDVPDLYMCGAKITFAADAPIGIESVLVRDVPPKTFGVEFDVRRISAREIQLHTLGPSGWSGTLYVTTTDGHTIADTFAGIDGKIEQLYCHDTPTP